MTKSQRGMIDDDDDDENFMHLSCASFWVKSQNSQKTEVLWRTHLVFLHQQQS